MGKYKHQLLFYNWWFHLQALFPWGCLGYELDDVQSHPTFAHSMPRPTWVLLSFMRYFRWAHIGIISSSDDIWVETATKVWVFSLSQTDDSSNWSTTLVFGRRTKPRIRVCNLGVIQVADALRSHGLAVKLVSFMENTPHAIRRTLSKVRQMKELRGKFSYCAVQIRNINLQTSCVIP